MSESYERVAPGERAAGGGRRAQPDSGVERPLSWNPDLVEALQGLLLSGRVNDPDLDRELTPLVERYGEAVYSELIYLLCHLHFEPGEASEHWQSIIELRRSMGRRLGSPVDLRVVLVSYFLEVSRRLENPTVIEMRLFEQARELAYRDELTGLHNYRYFNEFLAYELHRCEQYDSSVSLVMIDIDDFKAYNDRLGHLVGNEALVSIASLIAASLRKVDLAARYGGEEFAVVAPETSKLGARELAERIRRQIDTFSFRHEERQLGGRLTASLGVATYPADGSSVEKLVRRADRALYLAKSRGKNQVCLYDDNRRSFRRIPATVGGHLRHGTEEATLTTLDLGRGGIRFLTELSLSPGALLEIGLRLPQPGGEIALVGRVVHSERGDGGRYETALQIIEMRAPERYRYGAALEEISSGDREGERVEVPGE